MEETLLQAENKFLQARIDYLELKLSSGSNLQELLSKEYVDLFQLDMDQLKDLCQELGIHKGRPSYAKWKLVYPLHLKMDKVVEKVKEFKSRGLCRDVFIWKLKDFYGYS